MSRNEIIEKIVADIPNKVNLKNPNWVLHYEIIGNITGISLMNPTCIFRVISERNILLKSTEPV